MLNLIDFKEKILSKLEELVSENDLYEITEKTFHKINRDMDAVAIMLKENKEGTGYGQIHYYENLYSDYKNGLSVDEVVRTIMDSLKENRPEKINLDMVFSYEECREKIAAQVISRERNEAILEECVHRDILDLALVYRIILKSDDQGMMSTIITKEIADNWGVNEEELYKVALKNTKASSPYRISNMYEMIFGCKREGVPPVFVLAKESGGFGASAIAYPEEIKKAKKLFKGDFFIFPSSQHDLVLIPYDPLSVETHKEMVKDINKEAVDIADWLSDSVYYYDCESEEVKLAI